jgi:hypothetical protein
VGRELVRDVDWEEPSSRVKYMYLEMRSIFGWENRVSYCKEYWITWSKVSMVFERESGEALQ